MAKREVEAIDHGGWSQKTMASTMRVSRRSGRAPAMALRPKSACGRRREGEDRIRLIKPFMAEVIGRQEPRQLLGVWLRTIGAQALQFDGLHRGNIHTDGERHLRGMEVQGELRGHLGWQRDIIQPWGHDRRGAIAVKRLGRRAVHGYVIVVTRDPGRAKGDDHIGPHRGHGLQDIVGERGEVGGAERLIAVAQEDRRVGSVEGEHGAQFGPPGANTSKFTVSSNGCIINTFER